MAHGWLSVMVELAVIASMLYIGISDWRFRRVPEACTLPLFGVMMYYALVTGHIAVQLAGAALIGAWLFITRLAANFLNGKQNMGFGDVTMGAVLGAISGPVGALAAISVGLMLGIGIEQIRQRLQPDKKLVPMATYMALGMLLIVVFGPYFNHRFPNSYPLTFF